MRHRLMHPQPVSEQLVGIPPRPAPDRGCHRHRSALRLLKARCSSRTCADGWAWLGSGIAGP